MRACAFLAVLFGLFLRVAAGKDVGQGHHVFGRAVVASGHAVAGADKDGADPGGHLHGAGA